MKKTGTKKASITNMPGKAGSAKNKTPNPKPSAGKMPAMKKGGSMGKKGC